MTCLLSGLDNRPGRFAHPRPGRPPPPIWDPPPPTPPGWDHVTGRMITPKASKVTLASPPSPPAVKAASPAASSFASKDLPLKAPKVQQYLGSCRQYCCSEVFSEGSAWKKEMMNDSEKKPKDGKSLLLKNDITYAHINTPGVCVLRTMSLPNIPPPAAQESIVRFLKRSIGRKEREDARASKAFAVQKALLSKGQGGGEGAASSEILPKHQTNTAGKPAICRPIDESREAVAKMFNAEDSHFTSEYRSKGWWKQLPDKQKRELKEHVAPVDSWTKFRNAAAEVNKFSRFPINTY